MISTPETAATRTSKVDSIIPQSRIGNMSLLGPDKNRETGTLSTEVIGLTAYFAFYNEDRPQQSLNYKTPAAVHQTASGGGAMILEKYGDSLPEASEET